MIVHSLPKNEIFSIRNTLPGTGSGQEEFLKIGKKVESSGGWHKTAVFRGEKPLPHRLVYRGLNNAVSEPSPFFKRSDCDPIREPQSDRKSVV